MEDLKWKTINLEEARTTLMEITLNCLRNIVNEKNIPENVKVSKAMGAIRLHDALKEAIYGKVEDGNESDS